MSAQVERTALVDRGHNPEIVREVTIADLSAASSGDRVPGTAYLTFSELVMVSPEVVRVKPEFQACF